MSLHTRHSGKSFYRPPPWGDPYTSKIGAVRTCPQVTRTFRHFSRGEAPGSALRPRCAWPLLCARACLMRVWLRTRGLGACACAVQLVTSPARHVASLHCFACCVSGCFFAPAFGCYLLMGRARSCSAHMLDVCNVRRPRPLQIDICDPASILADS